MYEKTISRRTVFKGRILDVDVLDVELEDGRHSIREIVQHGVAVAIIPRLPDGRFIFIRQFRKAMERVCFEVVAGNCDSNEATEHAAARELQEETGWTEFCRFERPSTEKLRARFKLQTSDETGEETTGACPARVAFEGFRINDCEGIQDE